MSQRDQKRSNIRGLLATGMAVLPAIAEPLGPALAILPPDQHPALVYLAQLRATGRRTQRQGLQVVAGILSRWRCGPEQLEWSALRYQHVAAVRAVLADHYHASTCNRFLAALRGVLLQAFKLGQMSAEDYQRAILCPRVAGESELAGRMLENSEAAKLHEACRADTTPAGARDAALLALLWACGLRRAEVVELELADYTPATGALFVCRGKGNKERTCYVPEDARPVLAAWVQARGTRPGAFFCPVGRKGDIRVRHATTNALYQWVLKRADEARLSSLSPHDFRRTFASNLIDLSHDLKAVRDLMGHRDIQTTIRYDRRGERAKIAAAQKLEMPWLKFGAADKDR